MALINSLYPICVDNFEQLRRATRNSVQLAKLDMYVLSSSSALIVCHLNSLTGLRSVALYMCIDWKPRLVVVMLPWRKLL